MRVTNKKNKQVFLLWICYHKTTWKLQEWQVYPLNIQFVKGYESIFYQNCSKYKWLKPTAATTANGIKNGKWEDSVMNRWSHQILHICCAHNDTQKWKDLKKEMALDYKHHSGHQKGTNLSSKKAAKTQDCKGGVVFNHTRAWRKWDPCETVKAPFLNVCLYNRNNNQSWLQNSLA